MSQIHYTFRSSGPQARARSPWFWVRSGLYQGGGLLVASLILPGLSFNQDPAVLLGVVLVLTFLNIVLRPLLLVFTLPFIVFTAGLGILLINAFLLMLAHWIIPPFEINTFWTALGAAVIMAFASLLGFIFVEAKLMMAQSNGAGPTRIRVDREPGSGPFGPGPSQQQPPRQQRPHRRRPDDDDVIDI